MPQISELKQIDVTTNGLSPLVPLGPNGGTVTVDCVDADGESQDWGGATVDLIYSPDGKITQNAEQGGVQQVNFADGFSKIFEVKGYAGIRLSNYSAGSFRVLVT